MKAGTVVAINHKLEKIAVIDSYGDFTIIELLGAEVELGDKLTGDLHTLGEETFYNETQDEKIKVFVDDHSCGNKVVVSLLNIRKDNKKEWESL